MFPDAMWVKSVCIKKKEVRFQLYPSNFLISGWTDKINLILNSYKKLIFTRYC